MQSSLRYVTITDNANKFQGTLPSNTGHTQLIGFDFRECYARGSLRGMEAGTQIGSRQSKPLQTGLNAAKTCDIEHTASSLAHPSSNS